MPDKKIDDGDWFVCYANTPWFIGRCLRQYRTLMLVALWFPPFDEPPTLAEVEAMNLELDTAVLFLTAGLQGFDSDPPYYMTLGHTDADPEAWKPPIFLEGPEGRSSQNNFKVTFDAKLKGHRELVTEKEKAELPYHTGVAQFGYPPGRLDYVWTHRDEPGLNLQLSRPWP